MNLTRNKHRYGLKGSTVVADKHGRNHETSNGISTLRPETILMKAAYDIMNIVLGLHAHYINFWVVGGLNGEKIPTWINLEGCSWCKSISRYYYVRNKTKKDILYE